MKFNHKAQITIEYFLFLAALIIVLIVFLKANGGVFTEYVNEAFEVNVDSMGDVTRRILRD